MSLYRSQSSPQGAKRFRMNSSYHDAPYSRDHRSFRYVLMVNLEEEDYQGDIYKIAGNGYAACIITEFLRCLAALHSWYYLESGRIKIHRLLSGFIVLRCQRGAGVAYGCVLVPSSSPRSEIHSGPILSTLSFRSRSYNHSWLLL
ncbi:hypothetical protein NC651_025431 [Populus alba x Populus x berolinensis]|nr:hypothetical protein NC651_025431 [Populus alba x Populus x berolinensis]